MPKISKLPLLPTSSIAEETELVINFDGKTYKGTLEDLNLSGGGGGSDRIIGWQDFSDGNTRSNPLQITSLTGSVVTLTNDAQGALTDGNVHDNTTSTPTGVSDLWNPTANRFVFDGSGLEVNDYINLRVHLDITPSVVPVRVEGRIVFYATETSTVEVFSLPIDQNILAVNAGVSREVISELGFFIGESIENGSAEVQVSADGPISIEVIGFNTVITKI